MSETQQGQVQINPSTGQPDYSQQWIDYYRSLGLVREVEAIEKQVKQRKPGAPQPQAIGQQQQQQPGGDESAGGGGGSGGAGQPDYSAQWAEYYCTVSNVKEAEAIESQMKKGWPSHPGGGTPQTTAGQPTGPQPGGMGGPQPGMGGYGGPQGYGAPMPYPGAPMPYPGGYAQPGYPGGRGFPPTTTGPDHHQ